MKIKCPQCSANNEMQKFCGSCGTVLLADGAEINPELIELEDVTKRPNKKKLKWFKAIGIFLLIYVVGGIIIEVFALRSGLESKYASAISFVAAIIIAIYYISTSNDATEEETEINA